MSDDPMAPVPAAIARVTAVETRLIAQMDKDCADLCARFDSLIEMVDRLAADMREMRGEP